MVKKMVKTKVKLKVDDTVVVISGTEKGKRGKIRKIDRQNSRLIIEGINKRTKYVKPSQAYPEGGVINIEFPIHLSNVMIFCDSCKKNVRISVKLDGDTKSRVCNSCGKSLDK